jgi:ribosomal protein L11 methyltransferase
MSRWLEAGAALTPAAAEAAGFEQFIEEDGRLLIYLSPEDPESLGRLRKLAPDLTVRERCETEWSDAWKQYYKPTPVGERLLIQPSWLPVDNPEGRAVYLNDPGMAFGTGLHASTRLCLEMLESVKMTGRRVLDIGCGSGILGLCALLLGAGSALGVDIDPYAVRTAEENAKLNGVEDRFTARAEDFIKGGSAEGFDLVFSNIIADVIIPLAPVIAPSDVIWVASGIIEHRLDDVLNAAESAGFNAHSVRIEDGWAAVILLK